jgi:hypothetical protein
VNFRYSALHRMIHTRTSFRSPGVKETKCRSVRLSC